jgi:hypothetical protein
MRLSYLLIKCRLKFVDCRLEVGAGSELLYQLERGSHGVERGNLKYIGTPISVVIEIGV